jgi:prevent-host-death family protein
MRFVTAQEAHQGFSKILKQVEGGETLAITRHGRPIATLRPYAASDVAERELAIEYIVGLMRKGIPINRRFVRDEMHQRE